MITVGLTGGIGSGKSTVAKMFEDLSIPIFIADIEAKRLMNSSKIIRRKLVKEFGDNAYTETGLNRPFIASIVFNNKEKLSILNSIVHPKVHQSYNRWLKKHEDEVYTVYEAAIIFELGRQNEFDYTILVTADENLKFDRLIKRDNTTKEELQKRMNNQWSDEKKIPLADFVIENDNLNHTKAQVSIINSQLIKKHNS